MKVPVRSFILALAAGGSLLLGSCSEAPPNPDQVELQEATQRSGPMGTVDQPAPLDPFRRYTLVLAANECRYFSMKIPDKWYWKVFLTVDNREVDREGKLTADISRPNPPWAKLEDIDMAKVYVLRREGVQGILGVGNLDGTRTGLLRICQQGAPLKVTLTSEVSLIGGGLMGPKKGRK